MKRLAVAVAPHPTATRRTGLTLPFLFTFQCESNIQPVQRIVHEGRHWREIHDGQVENYCFRTIPLVGIPKGLIQKKNTQR
eukprot:2735793-Pyramimonas_sp.AAC.1